MPSNQNPSSQNSDAITDFSNSELLRILQVRRQERWEKYKENRALQKLELEICRRDRVHWINNWVYFYEPRNLPSKPALIPVICYPKQQEYLSWIDERRAEKESGIAEKTRGAGLTYLSCAYALHCWLFEDGFKAAFGSRVEDLVDRSGDPDCIFEKLRIILRHLPTWMMPRGFIWDGSKKHDKFMRLVNPSNDAVITGEGGDSMGRGGRNTVYFVDEAAYIARADVVDAALVKNTNTVIYVSTPPKDSTGNSFVAKRNSGKYNVFTFTYHDNLSYSQADYEKDKEILDPILFAREINLDYSGGTENVLIPALHVDAAIHLGKILGLDEYSSSNYQDTFHSKVTANMIQRMTLENSGKAKVAALDVAYSGSSKNVFGVRDGICLILIDSWREAGTTESAWRAIELCKKFGVSRFIYDNIGVGAGIAGVLDSCTDIRFEHTGFNGNYECTSEVWDEFGGRESKEVFKNLRAECAWKLRIRFEKTYEFLYKKKQHPLKELIAIPEHVDLRNQLSAPKYFYTDRGQIRVEAKKEMKRRGIESPDFFDMAMMVFTGDELGFDYLDALTTDADMAQLTQLHGNVPISKIELLKASIHESIHMGQPVRFGTEDCNIVRDILLQVSDYYASQEDSVRWMIAVTEVRKIDAIKKSH